MAMIRQDDRGKEWPFSACLEDLIMDGAPHSVDGLQGGSNRFAGYRLPLVLKALSASMEYS